MPDLGYLLKAESVRKSYGPREVLKGVSLELGEGEVVAVLGPNGAGKTTLVEILEGLRRQDAGNVTLLGKDPRRLSPADRAQIGVVLQDQGIEGFYKVRELLELRTSILGEDHFKLAELFDLTPVLESQVRKLSGGFKRRVVVALAFAGAPRVVFLDEPSVGMDPESRLKLWEVIRDFVARGTSVLLTTHYLEEAERLADRVILLSKGEVVASGEVAEVIGSFHTSVRIRFRIANGANLECRLPLKKDGEYWQLISTEPEKDLHELTAAAISQGLKLERLEVRPSSLEEVFLELMKTEVEEDAE